MATLSITPGGNRDRLCMAFVAEVSCQAGMRGLETHTVGLDSRGGSALAIHVLGACESFRALVNDIMERYGFGGEVTLLPTYAHSTPFTQLDRSAQPSLPA